VNAISTTFLGKKTFADPKKEKRPGGRGEKGGGGVPIRTRGKGLGGGGWGGEKEGWSTNRLF